mmetsp:Transcript_31153/g.99970  ORF Transcript_31153/g.99970 Transcript_31153/m.99970 type:complete len:310 (+) Transcript_31153:1238-2167(+)
MEPHPDRQGRASLARAEEEDGETLNGRSTHDVDARVQSVCQAVVHDLKYLRDFYSLQTDHDGNGVLEHGLDAGIEGDRDLVVGQDVVLRHRQAHLDNQLEHVFHHAVPVHGEGAKSNVLPGECERHAQHTDSDALVTVVVGVHAARVGALGQQVAAVDDDGHGQLLEDDEAGGDSGIEGDAISGIGSDLHPHLEDSDADGWIVRPAFEAASEHVLTGREHHVKQHVEEFPVRCACDPSKIPSDPDDGEASLVRPQVRRVLELNQRRDGGLKKRLKRSRRLCVVLLQQEELRDGQVVIGAILCVSGIVEE